MVSKESLSLAMFMLLLGISEGASFKSADSDFENRLSSLESLLKIKTRIVDTLSSQYETLQDKIKEQSETITKLENELADVKQTTRQDRSKRQLTPEGAAAFTVYLSHDITSGTDQTIKFDKVITNEGNGYNVHSGVFTCPLNGVYLFSYFIGERDAGHGMYAYLKVNSVNQIDAVVDTFHDTQDLQGGNTVVLRLNAGDVVWISGSKAAHAEGSTSVRITSFTGVFLYE